jgi:tetratricopeptide (TPR) repeat protein
LWQYLHCLYFVKLVYPVEQSPEYAFNCIPTVARAQDPRFAQSIAAYATLAVLLLLGFYQALRTGSALWSCVQRDAPSVHQVAGDSNTSRESDKTGTMDRVAAVSPFSVNDADPAAVTGNEASSLDDEAMPELIPVQQQEDTAVLHEKALNSGRKKKSPVFTKSGLQDSPTMRAGKTMHPELVPETEVKPAAEPGSEMVDAMRVVEAVVTPCDAFPYDAVLHTLMLFTVFFLPASGVVFKLGTLLAERLMYTPSMPVCMLLSAAAYYGSSFIAGLLTVDLRNGLVPAPAKKVTLRGALTLLLFSVVVGLATYAYAQRTIAYNPVWHDDNTLFVESLKVCPNSAKMNLQVSKVYSQKGDFKKARKHLDRAIAIDPDFCDTGYQDVVLTAAGEGKGANLDLAAEKAVKNLHCIYTNAATFTLLSQIWSAQLQSVTATGNKQRLFQELEKQGRIAQAGDVKFLAAQKYIEASSIAFDAQFPDEAIALADKARKIVTSLESSRQNEMAAAAAQSDEEMEVTADLRCRIFTLSGIFRATQLPALKEAESSQSKKDSKKKASKDRKKAKSSSKAEVRVLELLHRAVFRDCKEAVLQLPYPAVGPVTGRGGIAVEHLPIAINHLVSLWTARVNNGVAINAQEGAQLSQLQQYAANLTSAFYVAEMQRSRSRYPDDSATQPVRTALPEGTLVSVPVLENAKVKELCETLARLAGNAHYLVGTKQLQSGAVAEAVHSFRQSLFVFVPTHAERQVDSVASGRAVGDLSATIEELPALTLNKESCMSMHW